MASVGREGLCDARWRHNGSEAWIRRFIRFESRKKMDYEIKTERYTGPLEKLLELIEDKKLEITQVNLAEVTNGFLTYLKTLETERAPQSLIADFLVVASKLILIKSKVLLPSFELSQEEESDVKNLEDRLRLYQELRETQTHLKKLWHSSPQMFDREFLASKVVGFFPPKTLSLQDLSDSVSKLLGELEKMRKPAERVKNEIISLKQKIQDVLGRLSSTPLSFKKLGNENAEKQEMVILFLAVLHLIKEQFVSVDQGNHFDEIFISLREGK